MMYSYHTHKILYRVYWVQNPSGGIQTSFEAYGATQEQFSQSKGKINGGSSYAVPVVIH